MKTVNLGALTEVLFAAVHSELQRRLTDMVRTNPSVAREVATVSALIGAGRIEELPAEWCRRLKLPVHPVNRGKTIVAKRKILGRNGEDFVELDRVVFDQQLQEGAVGRDVWLEVTLVHPADLPSHYRCWIATRFSLVDMEVSVKVAEVQLRWSERFGAHFFSPGKVHPYIYSPGSGKVTRAYGAKSRVEIARDASDVYQYLTVIAAAWDWYGTDPHTSTRTVRQRILANMPQSALDLFAEASTDKRSGSRDERPKLKIELVDSVGQALGYVSASGARRARGRVRPAHDETDKRLLPLVAKILAQKHHKPSATLLRTVVRPALLQDAFTGLVFESVERVVRSNKYTDRKAQRGRKPAQQRRSEQVRK